MIAGWGPHPRVEVEAPDSLSVDMRLLVDRLQRMAREAGAEFRPQVGVEACGEHRLVTNQGTFEADWIVDASGIAGAAIFPRPWVDPTDLCGAAQGTYRVSDMSQAEGFFEERGARPGQTLCYTGVAGGFSVVNLRLHGESLGVLTGSIPASGAPSGQLLLQEFVRDQRWIGSRSFGGARAIPVCSPFSPLFSGRVAFVGDAACQVFPAHGSGIGSGMIAARMLADALSSGQGLHGYAASWHHRYGALHASYDLMRRLSQTFTPGTIGLMMRHHLLDETSLQAGLGQVFPALSLHRLRGFRHGARQVPHVARPIVRAAMRIPLLQLHHRMYPVRLPRLLPWWWTRLRQLVRLDGTATD